jgi:hypothetical protein
MTAPLRSMPNRYELYRVILDYEALQDGFLDRIDDLNTTLAQVEISGGLTCGNAYKLLRKDAGKLRSDRPNTPSRRTFGWESLGKMLKGTGLALALVVDDAKFAPLKEQLAPRKRPSVHRAKAPSIFGKMQENPTDIEELVKNATRARMREIGMKGNKSQKRRAAIMKRRARQRKAAHAARIRWEKQK